MDGVGWDSKERVNSRKQTDRNKNRHFVSESQSRRRERWSRSTSPLPPTRHPPLNLFPPSFASIMANVFPLSFPPRPSNPSPFGFGFGGGVTSTTPSSFGSPLRRPPQLLQPTTPSSSFGRPYQPPSPSVFGAASAYGTSAPSPSKRKSPSTSTSTNSTKRRGRESDEDDEEEEEDSYMGGHAGGGERQIAGRVIVRRGGKKSRLQTEQHEPPTSSKQLDSPSKAQQDDGVDVGVLLGEYLAFSSRLTFDLRESRRNER